MIQLGLLQQQKSDRPAKPKYEESPRPTDGLPPDDGDGSCERPAPEGLIGPAELHPPDALPETQTPAASPGRPDDKPLELFETLELELEERGLDPESEVLKGEVPKDPVKAVEYWLRCYDADPRAAAQSVKELAARTPESVARAVICFYKEGHSVSAGPFLARLFAGDQRLAAALCNTAVPQDSSVRVATELNRHEPAFEVGFARMLLADGGMNDETRQRGLAVLEEFGGGIRLVFILIQFMRDPDARIRSKAARIVGKFASANGIATRVMSDKDPRIRANFLEGLWSCTTTNCRPIFRQGLKDPHHRVVGNALVGLYILGGFRDIIIHLRSMYGRPEAIFRATAAWVMGKTGDERFAGLLSQMTGDSDHTVRRSALRALQRFQLEKPTRPVTTEAIPDSQRQA